MNKLMIAVEQTGAGNKSALEEAKKQALQRDTIVTNARARACMWENRGVSILEDEKGNKSLRLSALSAGSNLTGIQGVLEMKSKLIGTILDQLNSGAFVKITGAIASLRRSGAIPVVLENMAATLSRMTNAQLGDLITALGDIKLNNRYNKGSLQHYRSQKLNAERKLRLAQRAEERESIKEARKALMEKAAALRQNRKLPRGHKVGAMTQGRYWKGVQALAGLDGNTRV